MFTAPSIPGVRMTHTMPTVPLAVALQEALKRLGRLCWVGITPEQADFVRLLDRSETALGRYDQWVDGTATDTAPEINDWLAGKGFDIELDPWPNDGNHFGVAGVSKVAVKWVVAGTRSSIFVDNMSYPAFDMTVGNKIADVFSTTCGEPIVELYTNEGMIVRAQVCEDPGSTLLTAEGALQLHSRPLGDSLGFKQIRLPMVSLNAQTNLAWLLGLFTPKPGAPDASIVQVVSQTKFRMNELGAYIDETAAAHIIIESVCIPFEIKKPFLLSVGFPDIAPVFGAYITPQHWADPDTDK